jgi:hypothetical protein
MSLMLSSPVGCGSPIARGSSRIPIAPGMWSPSAVKLWAASTKHVVLFSRPNWSFAITSAKVMPKSAGTPAS